MPSRIRTMSLSRRTLIEACRSREARLGSRRLDIARYQTTTPGLPVSGLSRTHVLIPMSLRTACGGARGLSTGAHHMHTGIHSHTRDVRLGYSSSLQQTQIQAAQVFQLQRRNFVSLPSPIANDGMSKPKVQDISTQSAESVSVDNENDPSSSSNALFFAAQESSRLSKLAAQEHKRGTAFTETSVQLALDAASALLIISRPSNALADAILHRSNNNLNLNINSNMNQNQNVPQIASLHRAFLEITSWCIDLVPYRYEQQQLQVHDHQQQAQQQQQQNQQQQHLTTIDNDVLDRSLTLARRAYDLRLPFHLPLYNRLMEAVATHQTDDAIASTILDISSWVVGTLDAPVNAAFFSRSLTILVRRQQLGQVVELLQGMRMLHNIPHLDPATTTEILTLLRDALRESLLLQDHAASDSNNDNINSRLSEEDATQIVSLLEPSVLHVLETRESSEQLRDRLTNMLSELENDEMAELLERLSQVEDESDPDDDDDDDDDDIDSDEEAFDSDEDSNYAERGARADPIDQIVDSILTKNVTDVKAKRLLSDLIKNSRSRGGDEGRTRMKAMKFKDGEETVHAIKLEIDVDPDLSDDEEEDEQDDLLYSRDTDELYQFPDVTAQVVQLNAGRSLRFTRRFEDILWSRDYDDDFVLFDKLFRDSHGKDDDDDDSSYDDDDDSSSDDDDDEADDGKDHDTDSSSDDDDDDSDDETDKPDDGSKSS